MSLWTALVIGSQYTIPAMKVTGEALRTTLALKSNYISEVNEKVLKPLDDFLKTDLKEFKDSKKTFDKALEKYESTLTKFSAQSRQKEPSALREEAFQLYDIRKSYIQASMSCAMLCIKLQDTLDQLVLGVFLDLIATQHDYFSGNSDHFGSMALQVLQLKTYMKDHKEASAVTLQELEQNKDRYVADAIEHWKPTRSLQSYSSNLPAPASKPAEGLPTQETLTINTAVGSKGSNSPSLLPISSSTSGQSLPHTESHTVEDFTPTTKQGYLNIRIPQPRNRTPVWKRKYFFIQEGEFGFESVISNRTVGSQVVQSERISVLLCEVRYGSSSSSLMTMSGGGTPSSGSQGLAMVQMERRFCFEVVCVSQTYLLQAETEEEMMSWVNTFEAAKRDAVVQPAPRRSEPDEPYSPIPDSANPSFSFSGDDLLKASTISQSKSGDESEDAKPTGPLGLAWAANVPGVSLLLGSYSGNTSGANSTTGTANGSSTDISDNPDKSTEQEAPPNSSQTTSSTDTKTDSTRTLTLDTGASTRQRSWSVGEPAAGADSRSGHSQQVSEVERLMTSSLHLVPKPAPLPASEIPDYPMELVVRNRELHMRFHGTKIHSKEYVLHSWASGYRDDTRPDKPILTHGRIYLTQSGMYFYARGLSVETKRMYRFSIIRGIECEQKDISTEWRIETVDGVQHIFCQFTLADTEYQVLHLIWTNAHQQKDRLPVNELFKRTMLITNKPKGSAGSGSLAESESTHLTNREGTMTNPSGQSSGVAENTSGIESETASLRGDDEDWKSLDEDLPASLDAPSAPVECNCPGHLEKVELDRTFDIPAKTLNRLLFGDNSPIWKELHERRNNQVQSIGEWETVEEHRTRVVKFLMVVNNPLVKLNQTDCVETQCCEVEEEYIRYSYTIRTSVLAMPYSDAFTPLVRYCITYVSKNQCKLTCSIGIEWHKNPLVKAMIKGAVFKGTAETIKDIAEIIQLHLEHRKRKEKRSVPASSAIDGITNNHSRVDSAKIMISLNGPDENDHSILLNPQDGSQQPDFVVESPKDFRAPGLRRHTVSTESGPRVQGQWPTGSQPLFVPVGSKASRTKLLGKPSRSNLREQAAQEALNKAKAEEAKGGFGWRMKRLFGLVSADEGKVRRSKSHQLLYLVLLVSSLINIWAAYNTKQMLNPTRRSKDHASRTCRNVHLKGYPEPYYRVFNHNHMKPIPLDDTRNVLVAARAVYLKDLEELMQSGELEGFDNDGQKVDQKCFETFLEVRDSFRPWPQPPFERSPDQDGYHSSHDETSTSVASAQPTSSPDSSAFEENSTVTRYPWLLPHHRRWATWITFQRDRVGILRHDLLATFGTLKQLERRLLETEYVNWIMDERSRCRLWERKKAGGAIGRFRTQRVPGQDEEMEQSLDHEQLEEHIAQSSNDHDTFEEKRLDHEDNEGASDEDTVREEDEETRRKRSLEDQVAKEFCENLERQVELFMLDKNSWSSSAGDM
ncbi:MAG: hypothetical protein J3Q66DRAFT_344017 [Benniella sp.]|nr:MAG: hypothetical protein J3Q66DRAFT_344017 [Benniella sp.]